MANTLSLPQGMQITGAIEPGFETILTPEALARKIAQDTETWGRVIQLTGTRSE